jgi:hypothetical protein
LVERIFAPMVGREGIEGQDVVLGGLEHGRDLGQLCLQRGDRLWAVLVAAGVAEAVAEEVHGAALPGRPKDLGDRVLEPLVGVGDDQLHTDQPAGDQ